MQYQLPFIEAVQLGHFQGSLLVGHLRAKYCTWCSERNGLQDGKNIAIGQDPKLAYRYLMVSGLTMFNGFQCEFGGDTFEKRLTSFDHISKIHVKIVDSSISMTLFCTLG